MLNTDVSDLFSGATKIDEDLFEELEELLVTADLGIETTLKLMENIRQKAAFTQQELLQEIVDCLHRSCEERMAAT